MRNHVEEFYNALQRRRGLRYAVVIALLLHVAVGVAAVWWANHKPWHPEAMAMAIQIVPGEKKDPTKPTSVAAQAPRQGKIAPPQPPAPKEEPPKEPPKPEPPEPPKPEPPKEEVKPKPEPPKEEPKPKPEPPKEEPKPKPEPEPKKEEPKPAPKPKKEEPKKEEPKKAEPKKEEKKEEKKKEEEPKKTEPKKTETKKTETKKTETKKTETKKTDTKEEPKKTPVKGGEKTAVKPTAANKTEDDPSLNLGEVMEFSDKTNPNGLEGPVTIQPGDMAALGLWPSRVKSMVDRVWQLPSGVSQSATACTLGFTVDRDGQIVGNVEIVVESDTPTITESALQALEDAKFPPLPDSYEKPTVYVEYHFSVAEQ